MFTNDYSLRGIFKASHAYARTNAARMGQTYRVAFAISLKALWSDSQRKGILRQSATKKAIAVATAAAARAPRATNRQIAYLRTLVRQVPTTAAAHWTKGNIDCLTKAEASRAISALQDMASY